MKFATLLFTIMLSTIAQASEICYDDNPIPFEVAGQHCMNPYGDASIQVAQANADRAANELCSPFQAKRVSDYTQEKINECRIRYYGYKVTASYQCAR